MEIPTDYAQANFRYTGVAMPHGAEWTLGLDVALWAGTPNQLATALAADYVTTGFAANQFNGVTLSSISVKFGPTATGPTGLWNGSVTGASSSPGTAPMNSFLVHKVTAFGGRSGRGRLYMPGVDETQVSPAGVISPGTVTSLTADFEQFRTLLEARDLTCVLLHNAGAPLTIPTPITGFVCDSQVATQRRRNRR